MIGAAKGLLMAAALIGCPPAARAAEQGQLDASPSLFSVLAAINAAGYDADLDSPANHPLRLAVRKHLAAKKPDVLFDLRRFLRDHKPATAGAELSQYISFALSTDGPPDFKLRFLANEVPPDVAPLEGFRELMIRFHREADIDELWRQAQPAFEQAIARYHEPVTRAALEVNGYLRNVTSGYVGRRFQVYVDLLGAPNQIHTRSYADDYYVVVTPSPEPQTSDVRHAYLHYLLDPLVTKYAENVNKKKALADYAHGAPLLEEAYKQDFLLLLTECLIKAVEGRLAPASQRQAVVDQALGEGFILTPYFAEHLPLYEKQESAMRFYFTEMVDAIDFKKEERRLEKVEFATARAVRKAKPAPVHAPPPLTGVARTLAMAEDLYRARDLAKARQAFLDALQQTDEKTLHAKAYYGLARIATLANDPELAERLFQKVLELAPEPADRAWCLVYLGRLNDLAGERERAAGNYKAALAVEGATPAARQAAEKGLQAVFKKGTQ